MADNSPQYYGQNAKPRLTFKFLDFFSCFVKMFCFLEKEGV